MNHDKAREFFSAYYEGALDAGVRQALDQRMSVDPALRSDYAAFAETMRVLDRIDQEDVAVPIYLSDRIATRLEQEREKSGRRAPTLGVWLRGLAFAGLGAAAITGAVLSFGSRSSLSSAGIVSAGPEGSQPTFSGAGSSVTMNYRPHDDRAVIVFSGTSNREVQRFTVDADAPSHPFENRLPGTALFRIEVPMDHFTALLAIPGPSGGAVASGSGTVRDFTVALASRYHVPVLLRTTDDQKRLTWKLQGSDPREAATAALKDFDVAVDQRVGGMINLSDR